MPMQHYPTVFECTEMTAAVNKLPARPFFFKPLFEVKGVKTTTVSLDIRKGRIVLIGDSERNTAPESLAGRGARREWKHLSCAHLAQSDTLAPEDLQDVRAFGSTEPISVAAVYNDKMQQLKDNLAATMEFHRLGAIKGVVLDADGSTVLHDIFNTFGATKKTLDISFPQTAADDANPILTSILKAKRHVEAAMGGTPFDHIECIIGSDAYDMLTSHKLVREYFERWLSNRENFGDNDYRKRGFPYGGLTFVERSDVVGGQTMVAAKKGHVYPVGPGIFKQFHAPADWMETVNTIGLEYYARMATRAGRRSAGAPATSSRTNRSGPSSTGKRAIPPTGRARPPSPRTLWGFRASRGASRVGTRKSGGTSSGSNGSTRSWPTSCSSRP